MTLYSDVWRLPGPAGFVRDVARLAGGGQHVLAVVPRFIADDPEYSDALSVAILNELDDHQRVYPSARDGSLVGSLGFVMTAEFDDAPVTVPALISHRDVVGRAFVCNGHDLEPSHRVELPAFLRRLDDESRTIPNSERGTLVFVLGRDVLPDDPLSVATTRLWYWDRVSRWDVAALLSRHAADDAFAGVDGEIRLETIIEVAQWDLYLALELAREWSGGHSELAGLLAQKILTAPAETSVRRTNLKQPPNSHLESWDDGLVESWHGSPGVKFAATATDELRLAAVIWRAQARVLMPWLEERRVIVEGIVRDMLGPVRMAAAVDEFTTRFVGAAFDPTLIELSTLSRIVGARFGNTEARLANTARLLLAARNRLAHLKPLESDDVEGLVRQCEWLH